MEVSSSTSSDSCGYVCLSGSILRFFDGVHVSSLRSAILDFRFTFWHLVYMKSVQECCIKKRLNSPECLYNNIMKDLIRFSSDKGHNFTHKHSIKIRL